MNTTTIKNVVSAARAFYEASNAFDAAKDALQPLAEQQIKITAKVVDELGLKSDYRFRAMFYFDWIEFEIGGCSRGADDTPDIIVQLWERGRGGDSDQMEGDFILSQHIIDGKPELFEEELRLELGSLAARQRQAARERTQREINELQQRLDKLQKEQE